MICTEKFSHTNFLTKLAHMNRLGTTTYRSLNVWHLHLPSVDLSPRLWICSHDGRVATSMPKWRGSHMMSIPYLPQGMGNLPFPEHPQYVEGLTDVEQLLWLSAQGTREQDTNVVIWHNMHKKPHLMRNSAPDHDYLIDWMEASLSTQIAKT